MPDDHGYLEEEVMERIKMSFAGVDKLRPERAAYTASQLEDFWFPKKDSEVTIQARNDEYFKCPNCGKTHHTASFVRCEYCGFGRELPKVILGSACSATINYGFQVLRPECRKIKG